MKFIPGTMAVLFALTNSSCVLAENPEEFVVKQKDSPVVLNEKECEPSYKSGISAMAANAIFSVFGKGAGETAGKLTEKIVCDEKIQT